MKRSPLDYLILIIAGAAVDAWLSEPIPRLDDIGPMTLAAGLGLPVVLSYRLEALIVFGIGIALRSGWLSAGIWPT